MTKGRLRGDLLWERPWCPPHLLRVVTTPPPIKRSADVSSEDKGKATCMTVGVQPNQLPHFVITLPPPSPAQTFGAHAPFAV